MKYARLLMAIALLAAACRAGAAPNAAEIYRRAFAAMPKLSDADQKILQSQPNGAEAAALSQKLAPALTLYRQAANMPKCDWGIDLEKQDISFKSLLPHMAPLDQRSKVAAWEAERVKKSDPAAFVALHEDAIRSAAHAGEGWPLISGLFDAAFRQRSMDALAGNLSALTPEQLAKLGAHLATLPPGADFQKALLAEKSFGIDWFMRHTVAVSRDAQAGAAATNFALNLRMSAMASGGPVGLKIGLEENGGDNFWLGLGQRKHGIELVSADIRRGEAILFKDGQAALVLLQEKRIEPINVKLMRDEMFRLLGEKDAQKIFAGIGTNSTRLVHEMMEASDILGALAAASATPVKDPGAWGKEVAAQVTNQNVIAGMYFPIAGATRATMDAARAKEQMLQVALDVMRNGPAAAARSRDPWGEGAPYVCRETSDGYELVSQLQRDGKPVTLRVPRR
ncbi:MAG: hypothetical protein NTY53_08515 [Kiritimatiellaeota bacterium]|nr:hypothetical protein [Kiritimatiellota bacterium]